MKVYFYRVKDLNSTGVTEHERMYIQGKGVLSWSYLGRGNQMRHDEKLFDSPEAIQEAEDYISGRKTEGVIIKPREIELSNSGVEAARIWGHVVNHNKALFHGSLDKLIAEVAKQQTAA